MEEFDVIFLDDDKKTFAALTPLMTIRTRIGNAYEVLREQLLKVYGK